MSYCAWNKIVAEGVFEEHSDSTLRRSKIVIDT